MLRAGLEHFLKLANRGRHPAASGGEGRAARLAAAVLADLPGLDAEAVAGFAQFIGIVECDFASASRLVELGELSELPELPEEE